ncbi:cytochrome c-type biogenesis protein F2 [Salmonella enterica subsp. enterica]|uniref:Cytochrome c-type biogenesis protein F2 n=1 Tax=Salmonella enterica I TaxID=59201 RepID=A0A379W1L7_SALET|nr:cytochrome c-type biogenesis protein F2 [Salmonella enterica subsp. enterica]
MLSVLLPWLLEDKIIAMTAVGMAMACWIAVLAVAEAVQRVSRGTKTSLSYWGMVAAHLGLAVTITGIAFSQNYSVERDVRMRAGDSVTIHDYRFTFREVRDITGPNYCGGVALNRGDAPRRAGGGAARGETALQHQPDGDDRGGD